jgi:hypothetical protein
MSHAKHDPSKRIETDSPVGLRLIRSIILLEVRVICEMRIRCMTFALILIFNQTSFTFAQERFHDEDVNRVETMSKNGVKTNLAERLDDSSNLFSKD